jgi:elongation factor 1 alpha-like protein
MASRHVDDFDDDGFDDDYDEGGYGEGGEDELSPEDQAQMAEATAATRKALGPAVSKVTLAQIQDSLWHYYYDIDKTVAYLTKTYVAPAPAPKPTPKPAAKKVPEGMSNVFSCVESYHFMPGETWASHQRSAISGKAFSYADDHADNEMALTAYDFLSTPPPRGSLSAFFSDMPWLDVPEHRQTVFIAPEHPRGGLLGGGEGDPPMTKLQKLAAARKKKSEEKKENSKPKTVHEGMRKLSISEKGDKESASQNLPSAKRQKTTTKPDDSQNLPSQPSTTRQEPENLPDAPEVAASSRRISTAVPSPDNQSPVVSMVAPSAFARTLIGPALASRVNRTPEFYPMPYTSSPLFSRANFDQPSPDDIVLAAQAKGSNFARTK